MMSVIRLVCLSLFASALSGCVVPPPLPLPPPPPPPLPLHGHSSGGPSYGGYSSEGYSSGPPVAAYVWIGGH
jgi:hypothetical protein